MANEKKYYSFLSTYDVTSEKYGIQKGATLIGNVCNLKRAEGDRPTRASVAVKNRTKTVNAAVGTNFPEDQETVFVNLTFWRDAGKRLESLWDKAGDVKSIPCVLVGRLSKNEYHSDKTGKDEVSVDMSVDNWTALPRGNGGNNSSNAAAAAPASVAATGGFAEIENDGELPF